MNMVLLSNFYRQNMQNPCLNKKGDIMISKSVLQRIIREELDRKSRLNEDTKEYYHLQHMAGEDGAPIEDIVAETERMISSGEIRYDEALEYLKNLHRRWPRIPKQDYEYAVKMISRFESSQKFLPTETPETLLDLLLWYHGDPRINKLTEDDFETMGLNVDGRWWGNRVDRNKSTVEIWDKYIPKWSNNKVLEVPVSNFKKFPGKNGYNKYMFDFDGETWSLDSRRNYSKNWRQGDENIFNMPQTFGDAENVRRDFQQQIVNKDISKLNPGKKAPDLRTGTAPDMSDLETFGHFMYGEKGNRDREAIQKKAEDYYDLSKNKGRKYQ